MARLLTTQLVKENLRIEGLSDEYSFSALTLNLQDRGIISETRVTQSPNANADGITVSIDNDWLQNTQPSSFPQCIDPSLAKRFDRLLDVQVRRLVAVVAVTATQT